MTDTGYPTGNNKAELVAFEDLPTNHEEAHLLALMKMGQSNLARCYLDLKEQLRVYQKPAVAMRCCPQHQGKAFSFVLTAMATQTRQACPGCEPELFNTLVSVSK